MAAKEKRFGNVDGFHIVGVPSTRDESGMCVATYQYNRPGATQTSLARSIDKDIRDFVWFAVTNREWSVKDGQSYNMGYFFDAGHYEREAVGDVTDAEHNGFLSGFPAKEFMEEYARSRSLQIYLGKKMVADLPLKGSSAGIRLFKRCWGWLEQSEYDAAKLRPKKKQPAKDPFKQNFADTFKPYQQNGD